MRKLKVRNCQLVKQVKLLRRENLKLRKSKCNCERFNTLSKPLRNIVSTQLLMSTRNRNGRRWNISDINFSLSVYFKSPSAYKVLQDVMKLPSIRSLQMYSNNFLSSPGFCSKLLSALKLKVASLNTKEKLAVLTFDGMSVHESLRYIPHKDEIYGFVQCMIGVKKCILANQVVVFMLRGITTNWKQVFGIFPAKSNLTSLELKELINTSLCLTQDVGLTDHSQSNCMRSSHSTPNAIQGLQYRQYNFTP